MRTLGVVLALVFALTGCSSDPVPVQYDKQFADRLDEVRDNARTVRLKDLVPGDWDRVQIFLGPHTQEWLEGRIGQPLDSGEYVFDTEGNILVFWNGDDIERLVGTVGRLLAEGEFTGDATVTGEKDGTVKISG
ncbi:hypothetical protein [Kibdelosporangium aridum]|uniref:hypothetical protein n=1 Tax=Kibdelosporangium aridum TaxID=2030 RepID=UPI000525BA51